MKKYIVTEFHPSVKEGVILECKEDMWWYINEKTHDFVGEISIKDFETALSYGWIKESEETKYTLSDVKEAFRLGLKHSPLNKSDSLVFSEFIKKVDYKIISKIIEK